ncbi:MAG: hypothetical protein NC833_01070 [Candidatus Omnitrophica bacterium]|nr:hypothetical protein [Candidatus Omnitrophota bacterium]
MKKVFIFLIIFSPFLLSQTQIFLQITKNLMEKADVYLIFKIEKNDFSEKMINTLLSDLKYSGFFNIEGFKITNDVERAKKEIVTQIIIIGERKQDILSIKVENRIEGEIIFENNYKLNEPRYLSHIICDDIVEKLTGKPGIAKSKILFTSDKVGKRQIYIIDYDGFNLKQITDVDYLINYPKYFERNNILYVSYEDGWPKISKIDIFSKKIETFIAKPGLNACISICRETKEIALVLSQTGNPEIFIADFEGKIKRKITNYNGIDSSPSFSPDGKYIAFVSDRNGKPQIYIMNKDGYGVKRISFVSNYCTSPLFSPDGNFIAYIYSEGSGYGLALYDLNRHKTTQISGLNCEEISWAPNSRHIVYSKIGQKQPIMIIDIFTKEIRKLVSGEFNCLSPNWFILE